MDKKVQCSTNYCEKSTNYINIFSFKYVSLQTPMQRYFGRMYELVNFVSLLIIRVAMEEVGSGACFQFGYFSET